MYQFCKVNPPPIPSEPTLPIVTVQIPSEILPGTTLIALTAPLHVQLVEKGTECKLRDQSEAMVRAVGQLLL